MDLTEQFRAVSWWFYEVDEVFVRWSSPFSDKVVEDLEVAAGSFAFYPPYRI